MVQSVKLYEYKTEECHCPMSGGLGSDSAKTGHLAGIGGIFRIMQMMTNTRNYLPQSSLSGCTRGRKRDTHNRR